MSLHLSSVGASPCNERGNGQRSHLLLHRGQFDSSKLGVTWVECAPGSQQSLHAHPIEEQIYVIVRGRGEMLVGDEMREVSEGTLVYVPPGEEHAIRNHTDADLVYISASAPPFPTRIVAKDWQPEGIDLT